MATSFARKVLCTATVAACAWVGALASVQAAIVPGRFDPIFNATLGNVGYRGTAQFSIDDACLNLGGLTATPGGAFVYYGYDCDGAGPGSNAGMNFLGADVEFYDPSNPATVWGTVHFAGVTGGVLGMYMQSGAVTGIQSLIFGPATSMWTSNAPSDKDFFLQFGIAGYVKDDPDENHFPGPDSDGDLDDRAASDFKSATMWQQVESCVPETNTATATKACTPSTPAALAVPEPSSVLLTMAALAACGWVGRRRED